MRSFSRQPDRFLQETGFSSNFIRLWAVLLAAGVLFFLRTIPAAAAEDIVVVIDPGHGGANEGTRENGVCEKEMTLTTAQALYDRLTQYDGVTVYMTRSGDEDISVEGRAKFARSVEADFLFSIHYNASENHELFGSEVWVPLTAPYNAYGYQFGCTLLQSYADRGLFIRGVKTRRNDRGTDYYGILRYCVERDIPAILIEHCHVDEVRDYPYCDSQEKLETFGYEDAEAIAMFLGLASESLGTDYSGGPEDPFLREVYGLDTGGVVQSTLQDITSPEICSIERLSEDYGGLRAEILVTAADYDSPLMYYAYSVDGGETYSPRQPWPGCDTLTGEYLDVASLTLDIPEGVIPRIRLKAYNQFELTAESNILEGYSVFQTPREETSPSGTDSLETLGTAVAGEGADRQDSPESGGSFGWLGAGESAGPEAAAGEPVDILDFLLVSLLAAVALLVLTMFIQILRTARRRRDRYKRKE